MGFAAPVLAPLPSLRDWDFALRSFCSFDTLSVACYVFSGDSMKKLRAQFECAILVDGRTAWIGKRPVRVYRRIRARHPRAKISIRWTLKEGTLIASSEISLSYWA